MTNSQHTVAKAFRFTRTIKHFEKTSPSSSVV